MTDTENTIVKWENLVGSFLLSFGRIEWFTYYLLTRLPSEDIFKSVKSLRFSQRIELIKQLIIARKLPEPTTEQINNFFLEAKNLSEIRNTIAHNPLHLNIYDFDDEYTRRYQISRYGKLENPITLQELSTHCASVKKLADQCIGFVDIIDKVVFEQNRITNRSSGTREKASRAP